MKYVYFTMLLKIKLKNVESINSEEIINYLTDLI